jgi:hypothetical protein
MEELEEAILHLQLSSNINIESLLLERAIE